jgi:putative flippase GtrA
VPDLRPPDIAVTPVPRSGPELVRWVIRDRRVRYVATGVAATVIYYVYFAAGWLVFSHHISYLAMAVIANSLTALTSYPIYRLGVFRWDGPWWSGFIRFTRCSWVA